VPAGDRGSELGWTSFPDSALPKALQDGASADETGKWKNRKWDKTSRRQRHTRIFCMILSLYLLSLIIKIAIFINRNQINIALLAQW
jgi:hypothetical protein